MGVSNVGWADLSQVEALSMELRTIRSRLRPNLRRATAASAKRVQNDARSRIRSQTTGKTTGGYPSRITYEVVNSNAAFVKAVVGPLVNDKNKKQAIQLEYGNTTQAPKPHLRPALLAEMDSYCLGLLDAADRSFFP